ncbi:uncharacterized protein LOC144658602 [Oculina patagonica]
MACNYPVDTNVVKKESEVETGEGQAEKKVSHRFSEPWEDSDVILVVEDEKFHVHRVILSMNSAVFKAMFKSQFKEATDNEIFLPEKKASEFLDFLKKVYGFQYIQEQVDITMENVGHLLKLSDEYQVKAIFDPCVKFLEDQPKTKENVMIILALGDLYHLENVCKGCDDLLKDLKLTSLSEIVHLQDLNRDKLQHLLTQRIERLETFLDELYPQFMGLVDCFFWLLDEHDVGKSVKWCTDHVSEYNEIKSFTNADSTKISACDKCMSMFSSIWGQIYYHYRSQRHKGCNTICDSELPSVMEKFSMLKNGR